MKEDVLKQYWHRVVTAAKEEFGYFIIMCSVCAWHVEVCVCVCVLGLSDYRDSTRHCDSLRLFTIVIVDCLII